MLKCDDLHKKICLLLIDFFLTEKNELQMFALLVATDNQIVWCSCSEVSFAVPLVE
jgi:hypothetical protein